MYSEQSPGWKAWNQMLTGSDRPAVMTGCGAGSASRSLHLNESLEKQWASFTQLVEEADDCAHDVFVRAEAAGDAPADRWRKVGRVAARGALGADAAISAQFALITWSATEIHRLALGGDGDEMQIGGRHPN